MIAAALSFFAAVRAGDLWARAAVVAGIMALIAAFIGWKIWDIQREAVARERARVERANQEAHRKANDAQRDVMTCTGQWNRETGRCE